MRTCGLERWRKCNKVEATIVTGGGLFALKGVLQDPDPRRMTVWLHEERSSVTPYGAADQRTMFTPDRSADHGRALKQTLSAPALGPFQKCASEAALLEAQLARRGRPQWGRRRGWRTATRRAAKRSFAKIGRFRLGADNVQRVYWSGERSEPRGCTATVRRYPARQAREMPAIALEDWRRKP